MDDVKVYSPETIDEQPFPQEGQVYYEVSSGKSGDTYSPQTLKPSGLLNKRIAHETIGQALNTKSKKILQEFQFASSGAIQIGKYDHGVSGDLRLTPNGIVARNASGNNTFAIDGNTGNAVFAGEVQAGSFISGRVEVGDSDIIIDGANKQMVFYDEDGIPVIVIGYV